MNNPIYSYLTTWCGIVLCAGAISLASDMPTVLAPAALFSVIPAFAIAATPLNNPELPLRILVLNLLAAVPLTLAFLAWSLPNRSASAIPSRSRLLWLGISILSVPYFLLSWQYGMTWQGPKHTIGLAAINGLFVAMCGLLYVHNHRNPSVTSKLTFHGLLFTWLAWGAFPWLGETP